MQSKDKKEKFKIKVEQQNINELCSDGDYYVLSKI